MIEKSAEDMSFDELAQAYQGAIGTIEPMKASIKLLESQIATKDNQIHCLVSLIGKLADKLDKSDD